MRHSKSSLFLMELIIALLFFSLASTVCIRLFVKSHTLNQDTTNLSYAVTQSQNLAEAFLGLEGDMHKLQELFYGSVLDDSGRLLTIYEDTYCSTLYLTESDVDTSASMEGIISADISVYYGNTANGEPIYSLHIDHHIAERRGSYE